MQARVTKPIANALMEQRKEDSAPVSKPPRSIIIGRKTSYIGSVWWPVLALQSDISYLLHGIQALPPVFHAETLTQNVNR
ncbi:hypothetical protein BST61_g1860 [Cercospora zeina]